MIVSRTKYEATEEEISSLFRTHGIGNVKGCTTLGDGEFNSAYKVTCEGERDYVLKIAPHKEATVLSYEKDMMDSEVYWYRKMKEHTDILCPEIYAVDSTCEIIKSCCFIMQMMADVKNDKYGYRQSGLYGSWYEALRSMAGNLVMDCKNIGYETPDGEEFIRLIDRHEDVLRKAPCRMVNFDLWDSNVLYDDGKLVWIDPERGFWGDPVADFITVGKGQKAPLTDKKKEIEIYNRTATEKIELNRDTEIRYACAVAYLALIEEVEKYVRYEPDHPNYIRNTVDARDMYDMAFEVMR